MKTLFGKTVAFLVAAGMAGALTACGTSSASELPDASDTSWEATVKRANAQGEVRFYSVAVPAQNESIVKAFNKTYPEIEVKVERGGAEIPARVASEIQSGTDGADIILNAGQQWYLDHDENLLEADGPAAEAWPDTALTGAAPSISFVPAGFITWNTEIFPAGFEDWDDLLAPEVKGKLGMRNIVDNVVGSHLQFLEDTNGESYLQDLAAQQPKFYESVSPLTQAVGSGEIGVSVLSTPAMVKGLQEKGAPLDYTIPEKSWSSIYLAGALNTTSRPDAARVFLDFLMSPEGQEAVNGNDYGGSPLENIPGTVDTSGMTILDDSTFGPAKVDEWSKKFDQLFASAGGSSK
jgi:iron(III) transport system substrate-binding protein